jgi:hypothetical protein
VNDLSKNLHEFIRFLDDRIELGRKQTRALADAEPEPRLLRFFQGDSRVFRKA